ncbi:MULTISPECIES: hypothetical protein [unclassified Modicisalibacter]|uniref:hypothetical protein n=1 Tax=unclassified Modicisalibacter TaxID=2679913 RepID=UPI001CCEF3A1|nr:MULTISPECIES: hypothetical protein [unclassified Modicisalibacter]MBZ9556915.1 hypothetical protein [Modicisalibacter sp. R2A 31.J]MBZ9574372.1 hypothetical protein [Modicisalibacter sp. MOD 31.J]
MSLIRKTIAGLILGMLTTSTMAMDQQDLEIARERAAMIDEIRNLLSDDSPSVRLAVFEQVMKDDDPVLRSMAMETAFSNDDERLKTAALRKLIEEREFIAVELIEPMDPSQPQAYTYNIWRELVLLELKIAPLSDEVSGRFRSAGFGNSQTFSGQLTRGGWLMQLAAGYYNCHLTLSELDGVNLNGSLECAIGGRATGEDYAGGNRASLPFRIRLS